MESGGRLKRGEKERAKRKNNGGRTSKSNGGRESKGTTQNRNAASKASRCDLAKKNIHQERRERRAEISWR